MDGLNNNINSFDLNYGNTFLFGDDLRNHNESRSTARVTPLTSPAYTSQECRRMSIDRMKDRKIAILMQKNNQLQMDLLAMQHQLSSHNPYIHEYGMLDQYSISSNNIQLKLLTTALDEKSEEIKQAKEEYDLIMEERTAVHKEMREQSLEIERLIKENNHLKEQLLGSNFDSSIVPRSLEVEKIVVQMKEMTKDNENMKLKLSHQKRIIDQLKENNEKTCKQLDQVVSHYHYLKKSFNQKRSLTEFPRCTSKKYEMVTETVKITDLKMALLHIVTDNSGDSDSGGSIKLGESASMDGRFMDHQDKFRLRPEDRLLDIDGIDVVGWTDEQVLDHLDLYRSGKYIKVVLSRVCGHSGAYHTLKTTIYRSAVESFGLSPLWLVTKMDRSNPPDQINIGDILQMKESSAGLNSVLIVRLSSSPFTIPYDPLENNNSKIKCCSISNESGEARNNVFSPPVLPIKRRPSVDSDEHQKSFNRLVLMKHCDQPSYNHSSTSLMSAPPIPPRSSTSLQNSFTENMDTPSFSVRNCEDRNAKEDSICENLKTSVSSAFSDKVDNEGPLAGQVMSISFSNSGDLASTRMPKLGKCRNLILGIPSQIFNLKQLGLHLLHSKNDQCLSSKSDVDISIVNQIFIRFIEPNSSARQAGLFEGDEIMSINNQPVSKMTSEEAEHILLMNPLSKRGLKREHKKLSIRIKVQFNPLKMYELCKERLGPSLDSTVRLTRFTRSMYDDSPSGSFISDKWNTHRLHVIRSSSNLNISDSHDTSLGVIQHLLTKTRTIRINMCSALSQIKVMGGSAIGIFISNIVYNDKESEAIDQESFGNKLALGDKIIEINGESYQRAVGEDAVTSLNRFGHQVTISVIYDPSGILAINSDPFCQEHFYMEATFSFSDLEGKFPTITNKKEKSTSLSTRLDNLGFSIYFIKNYHLNFEKGDILLVDATILPASMTRKQQDNSIVNDWHAWVVDKSNNKLRSGMIPSAFWVQKMMSNTSKTSFHRSSFNDKNTRFTMRSTPSSPKSDINTFLSSNSTNVFSHTCSKHQRQNSLSQKLLRRLSFRSSFQSTTTSIDETNKVTSLLKEAVFKPLKRISPILDLKRPVVILGAHSETISMILASKWSREFALSKLEVTLESKGDSKSHQIIFPVTIKTVSDLHQRCIYPIVLLLKYKSAKEIRQLKLGKSTQITINKSDSFKLFSQYKEVESQWSHLINGNVSPNSTNDGCQEIRDMINKIQQEDIWLRVDRYQYSS